MKIKTLEVEGFGPAIHAMRNPMNSWDRSDTQSGKIGEKDKELSQKLANSGPEHAKHLRMIYVWVEIWAMRPWWNEMDTYRAGVEKVSCSTMHKLMARPLTLEDFEHSPGTRKDIAETITRINWRMQKYNEAKAAGEMETAQRLWREVIELLPQSYIQRRTVCMSYAALRNIIKQREGHKLHEWHQFIDWARTLPESWMLFD